MFCDKKNSRSILFYFMLLSVTAGCSALCCSLLSFILKILIWMWLLMHYSYPMSFYVILKITVGRLLVLGLSFFVLMIFTPGNHCLQCSRVICAWWNSVWKIGFTCRFEFKSEVEVPAKNICGCQTWHHCQWFNILDLTHPYFQYQILKVSNVITYSFKFLGRDVQIPDAR